MKIFGLAGWSGSGKTTLMVRLLPEIVGRGHTVSTIKHAHHSFEIDTPGKDSFEHRSAGATEVMITGGMRWALMRTTRRSTSRPGSTASNGTRASFRTCSRTECQLEKSSKTR